MILNTVWFILMALLFTGFFFLEGFDFGVGMLMPFISRKDEERRMVINTIGPVWDGNEVWLISAGAALFASFPHVYATLFSGMYIPLFLMLVALIVRGLSFEFRGKREDKGWRSLWDWALFGGSLGASFLWGVTVANLMRGFAIQADKSYYDGLLPLLNPYALLGGIVFVALFIVHGANFLRRKIADSMLERVERTAFPAWVITTVLAAGFLVWTFFETDILSTLGGLIPAILATLALLATGWLIAIKRSGWAFITGSLTIIFLTAMVFGGLYPRILISSVDPANSLTILNASSSPYTLKVMTIVAGILLPIVILYQAWTYRVFRKRMEGKTEKLIY